MCYDHRFQSRVHNRPTQRKRVRAPNVDKSSSHSLQQAENISILDTGDIMVQESFRSMDDNCIVIESDNDDEIEITSCNIRADDSVICIGSVSPIPTPYSPTEGIEVISENIRHRGNPFQLTNLLPPVFVINQSTGVLEPTSDSTQVVTTSESSSLPRNNNLSLYGKNQRPPYIQQSPSYGESTSSDLGSIIRCPICLDDSNAIQQLNKQLVVTICGHIYCKDCLDNVLQTSRQCSKCRKRLTKKQYHPLYL